MTALHSSRWHRVASLKPRLSPAVRVRRQQLRGDTWYVLSDAVSGRSVRLNACAYALAGRLDGQRTVQQLWDWTCTPTAQQIDPPTQDEVIDMLARLREAGLAQFDGAADFELLLPHMDSIAEPRGRNSLLAWRVPIANPSALLERLAPLQRFFFSRMGAVCWLAAVGLLLISAMQHAPALWAHGKTWLATPRYALLAALLYVPIKLIHELAHGMAVRRCGGGVPVAGVTLMLLMPVPYVDASAASAFARRRDRVLVSAAGIMAELALAAIALPLWLWLDDGILRDAAFVTLAIAGVSTLLFNANPLQRLDGYFILTDALELPNLGPRSRRWWSQLLMRRVLRIPGLEPMAVARGEARWLAAYAPAAWLCSIAVTALAVSWLGQLSFSLGVACGLLLGWQVLLKPALRLVRELRMAALSQHGSARRWHRVAFVAGSVMILALLLPIPQRTLVQGVVWPPDQAQLRADEEGFVEAVLAADGRIVQAGEVVMQLSNPALQTRLQRQAARVSSLETTLMQTMTGDSMAAGDGRAGDARAELAAAQSELVRLTERVDALAVRAHAVGKVALLNAADLQGSYVKRGVLLGQVLSESPPTVRVALPESEAADLRAERKSATVRLASSSDVSRDATLVRDSLGAVMKLPSAALSAKHGGSVVTDPRDADDLKPMQPVVLVDVRLHGAVVRGTERIGERTWVRFDDGYSPALMQISRAVKREVQRRFNPQF